MEEDHVTCWRKRHVKCRGYSPSNLVLGWKGYHWHLLIRREVDSPNEIKYSLSNAAADTRIERLAHMQGQRFWIERSFQDGKSHCGLGD